MEIPESVLIGLFVTIVSGVFLYVGRVIIVTPIKDTMEKISTLSECQRDIAKSLRTITEMQAKMREELDSHIIHADKELSEQRKINSKFSDTLDTLVRSVLWYVEQQSTTDLPPDLKRMIVTSSKE